MTQSTTHLHPLLRHRRPGASPRSWAATLWAILLEWQRRSEDSYRLRHMGPHLLRDMGITAEEARAEADKPFWTR